MLARPSLALFFLLSCSSSAVAQRARPDALAPRTLGRLLVSGFESDAVHAYRTNDGRPLGKTTGVAGAQSIVRGPDGLLYVCAEELDRVLRLDPETLALLDTFVGDDPLTPEDEDGPLNNPTAAVFGPANDLFVASFETDAVLRYDGRTGAYLGEFVAGGLGGLDGPDAGTKFGPDGNLYVPSFWNDRVLRYDRDGAFLGEFIPFRAGNLRQPRDLVFHSGRWYVASSATGRVLRYEADGTFVDEFAVVGTPYSLAFHPLNGDLYVVGLAANNVRVFDGVSGEPLQRIVPNGAGGLRGATYLYFLPD